MDTPSFFEKQLCDFVKNRFDITMDDCGYDTTTVLSVLNEFFRSRMVFHTIYFMAAVFGLHGILECLKTLSAVYRTGPVRLHKSFSVDLILYCCNFFKALIVYMLWMLLTYGLLWVKLAALQPWIGVHTMVLINYAVTFISNLGLGTRSKKYKLMMKLFYQICFVRLVRTYYIYTLAGSRY
ncbi:uncharacterized protein LOC119666434 [Teleopsis dalmanni]|uniref:uncharacterized protein LOC119666434 n=1 Tax=Teleopsis dalmanni TaxID=139649 RepID=UPI0018CDB0B6|nr:uncharacterized protein LOC119666434 [Teleopsis dalmanni]